jgi:isopentenyl diphosphate isomerase/L-lactate dehydrogenase-like FMN-dependent dehydrogenase
MDGDIPRRDFLLGAGLATTAAVALAPARTQAAEPPPVQPAAAEASEAPDASKFLTLHQIIKAAHGRMSADAWTYLTGGVETETTLKRNRLALDSIALKSRVLRGVGNKVDASSQFFGHKLRMPVLLSAIGSIGRMDPGGAGTVAKAAGRFGVPMAVSSVAKPGFEAAAAAAPDVPKIYQLYVRGDDAWVDDTAKRVMDAGFTAFGFTVDSAVFSRRERDIVAGGINSEGSDHPDPYTSGLNWDHIKRFRDKYDMPISIKGITTAEDAELAIENGVNIIWVSTHGGRQLDHGRGTMDILPEVVETVHGRAHIIVDSGFCRGTDVVKAMAYGADTVAIGRLYCYGVGAAGEAGVVRVLEILEKEIVEAMSLMGVTSLKQLDRAYTQAAHPVVPPGLFSAFPLLEMA